MFWTLRLWVVWRQKSVRWRLRWRFSLAKRSLSWPDTAATHPSATWHTKIQSTLSCTSLWLSLLSGHFTEPQPTFIYCSQKTLCDVMQKGLQPYVGRMIFVLCYYWKKLLDNYHINQINLDQICFSKCIYNLTKQDVLLQTTNLFNTCRIVYV